MKGVIVEEMSESEKDSFKEFTSWMKVITAVATVIIMFWGGAKTMAEQTEIVKQNTKVIEKIEKNMVSKGYVDNKTKQNSDQICILRDEVKQIRADIKDSNKEMTELLRVLIRSNK